MIRLCSTLLIAVVLCCASPAQSLASTEHHEAEYYVRVYAQHYGVPVAFVRAIVQQESGWRRCPVSSKGAAGLMQLMPQTAKRLGVSDRCDLNQNVRGGVRYIAWLIRMFHGDLRLVAAAYYAPEQIVARKGLKYSNRDVIAYVRSVRALYLKALTEEPLEETLVARGPS
jgi:soluble lytic murein transglycosylase-like protein